MKARVKPNAARDAEIARLCESGLTRTEIGRRYGLAQQRVTQIAQAAGKPPGQTGQPRLILGRRMRETAQIMRASGASLAAIGHRLGIAAETARQRAPDLGISTNRRQVAP